MHTILNRHNPQYAQFRMYRISSGHLHNYLRVATLLQRRSFLKQLIFCVNLRQFLVEQYQLRNVTKNAKLSVYFTFVSSQASTILLSHQKLASRFWRSSNLDSKFNNKRNKDLKPINQSFFV